MDQIAQEIDSRAALWAYQNSNNIVGILGTDPADFDSSSAAIQPPTAPGTVSAAWGPRAGITS